MAEMARPAPCVDRPWLWRYAANAAYRWPTRPARSPRQHFQHWRRVMGMRPCANLKHGREGLWSAGFLRWLVRVP